MGATGEATGLGCARAALLLLLAAVAAAPAVMLLRGLPGSLASEDPPSDELEVVGTAPRGRDPRTQGDDGLRHDSSPSSGSVSAQRAAVLRGQRQADAEQSPEAAVGEASWRRHSRQQKAGLPPGPELPPSPEPPQGGETQMVTCSTTTGPITIALQFAWAPLGAARFLEMVDTGFFTTKVPLFRAMKGFICQTGVAGDPAVTREWRQKGNIQDDRQWLSRADPKRMKRGYLSFAGGGRNSRNTEFFFAFRDIPLGGSPWEVPFGTLVGAESFEAMDHWYTGYGDVAAFGGNAPAQPKMYREGVQYVSRNFPEIDYILECHRTA